jgi:tetratricopeptide (TPR) repeat protein
VTGRGYEEQLARHLYEQGRYEEAEAAFRLALSKEPHDARLHLALGLCIDPESRPDEALAVFRRAAELDPMLADAHNGIGICELDLGKAETAFRKALFLEPHSAEFHANLGFCLLRQERRGDAEPCLRQAVKLEPSNLGLLCDWAQLLVDLRRPRDAATAVRRVVDALGSRRDLLDKRAWGLYEKGRYQQANERLASIAGKRSEDEAWLYFIYGQALRAQGQLAPGADAIKIAIALAPGIADFHDELGQIFEALKLPDEAGAAYQRASQLVG